MQILQAAQQGDQQAAQIVQQAQAVMQDPQQQQQIVQAAQQGDQSAMAIIAVMMAANQAQSAKFGAKLSYIQRLRGVCPEGTEMQFFKQGGQVCKKCVQKVKMKEGGETPQNTVDAFKCGRKMKRKAACGTKVKMNKDGSKLKKYQNPDGGIEARYKGGTHSSKAFRDFSTGQVRYDLPREETIAGTDRTWYGKRPSSMHLIIDPTTNDSTVYEYTSFIPSFSMDFGVPRLARFLTGQPATSKKVKRTPADWERAKAAAKRMK